MAQTKTFAGLQDIDRPILGIYVALTIIGWLMIYAANYDPEIPFNLFDLSHNYGKQMFTMILCFAMMFVIMLTEWTFWRTFAFVIYIVSLLLLPGTLLFGREVNGAQAWYQIGGFSFQPSEIAKFGTCLAMAAYLSTPGANLRTFKTRVTAMAIFLVPSVTVLLQKDTGSALVFFSLMMVLYREGLSATWYVVGFGTAGLVIIGLMFEPAQVTAWLLLVYAWPLIRRFKEYDRIWLAGFIALIVITYFWVDIFDFLTGLFYLNPEDYKNTKLFYGIIPNAMFALLALAFQYFGKSPIVQRPLITNLLVLVVSCGLVFMANFACYTLLAPHQQQRVKIWLKPSEAMSDARGAAYNILHSKMAIGSGGLAGKGYLNGNMTRLNYVPAQSSDFIFCTVGEEQGFVGVVAIVSLFFWLLYRIINIAERQRSNFSRIYAYGVAGILFMHVLINLGMTMGLFPIIGIPLPFVSYGGTSLIGFSLMIAVLLKLDSHRNVA